MPPNVFTPWMLTFHGLVIDFINNLPRSSATFLFTFPVFREAVTLDTEHIITGDRYVSKDEYQDDWYSDYCSGSSFVFTGDLIEKLDNVAPRVKFFWVSFFSGFF